MGYEDVVRDNEKSLFNYTRINNQMLSKNLDWVILRVVDSTRVVSYRNFVYREKVRQINFIKVVD